MRACSYRDIGGLPLGPLLGGQLFLVDCRLDDGQLFPSEGPEERELVVGIILALDIRHDNELRARSLLPPLPPLPHPLPLRRTLLRRRGKDAGCRCGALRGEDRRCLRRRCCRCCCLCV